MRKFTAWSVIAGAIVIMHIACIGIAATASTSAAENFVDMLVSGRFADAAASLDPTMTRALPPESLQKIWTALTTQAGAFEKRSPAQSQSAGGLDIVIVPCEFARAVVDVKVVYDGRGRISGLWFLPGTAPAAPAPPPAYWHPDRFEDRPISVGKEPWVLPGALSVPKGPGRWPAVVLVAGSGPNDRDETIGPNKPFQDLAWGLASRGIAVVRYDKRTKVYGTQISAHLAGLTTREEVIDDALQAVKQLRAMKEIDPARVFALGHSLGGMMIPRIAQGDGQIAGFIIMAGATQPLDQIILDQMRYIVSLNGDSDAARKQLAETEDIVAKIRRLTPADESSNESLMGAAPSYWLDLRGYEPAASAREIHRPMLILQGGRDYQVTLADFRNWQTQLAGRKNVIFKFYPDLNHLFMTGQGRITPSEYDRPSHVAAEVVEDIAGFIQGIR